MGGGCGGGDCGCGASMSKRWMSAVFTGGSDVDPVFIPLSGALRMAEVEQIASAMEVVDRTANLEVRPAVRFSQDGVDWTSTLDLGDYVSSSGWSYNDFVSLEDTGGEYCQVGLQAKNVTSTSDIAKGVVNLRVEVRRP